MFSKSFRKTVIAGAAAGLMTFGLAGTAHALPSVQNLFTPGTDIWSDDSVEIFLDVGAGGAVGELNVGDILIGLFNITSYAGGGTAANFNQLTGLFAIKVVSATFSHVSAFQGLSITDYVFGPVSAADAYFWGTGLTAAAKLALGGLTIGTFLDTGGGALPASTMALFFEDDMSAPTLANMLDTTVTSTTNPSMQAAFSVVTDGFVRLVVGDLGLGVGDHFRGSGPTFPSLILGLPANEQVDGATFNFNGTITDSGFGNVLIGADIKTRNSTISAPPSGSSFPITDQTEFVVEVIPEPAGLAIFGMGLLALGGIARRRRRS